jgi:hypothetical protein
MMDTPPTDQKSPAPTQEEYPDRPEADFTPPQPPRPIKRDWADI